MKKIDLKFPLGPDLPPLEIALTVDNLSQGEIDGFIVDVLEEIAEHQEMAVHDGDPLDTDALMDSIRELVTEVYGGTSD